ncbi:MAG: preprotein translocase subunit SecY [Candidatus Methanomethylicota archaeon]|uniref:Protein translocase subunit SecY n=1 Tax=Thermoproteota archaeon TaxID=2056631 RepID=A0A497EVU1_9CREN|nr:MAG: preprotein translocase subunit SecY [Candidatus Verstraetearchaeota archaeon]RLE50778.1 MAG: preprotein translocase subunit SecY [Candidatus Verstraetearchaeota archaeon]
MGLIEALEPVIRHLPEVPRPIRKLDLRERFLWTGLALAIYLIMSHIPLYGVKSYGGLFEQLYFFRVIFASKRGSLMELGIGPIVTAGLIMQILVGSKLIKLDLSKPRERALFTGVQKLLAIIMTAVEGAAFILGGAYGLLSPECALLVLAQLVAVGIIVILLDEMIQKGWGLGSGVSLFILAGVSQQIAWLSLSPVGPVADGKQLGALIAFTQTLLSGENILNAFNRYPYPDMTGFFTMIAVFLLVVYFEGMRIEIPVAYARYGGLRAKIPLKFLYVSNIPIILASALFANILFFSRVLWMNFNPDNSNPILNLIVQFNPQERGFAPLPGTLVYYLTPVRSITEALNDPLHAIAYTIVLCALSVIFAIVWVQVSGMSARDQAEQLIKAGLQVPGFRSSTKIIEQMLNRYIPSLTIISGLVVGLIAAIADMLGALGSGIGILLSVGIIYQYYEILARERLEETYPALSKIFGR